jgi:hypothetical protein
LSETGYDWHPIGEDSMGWCAGCARWAKCHALALALTASTSALVCLLFVIDGRLGLHQSVSTRYRFHAIPVAVSRHYHNHPHDYTAIKRLAIHFHDPDRNIDDQIRETIHPNFETGAGTYYWVADDRGLADYVYCAFQLFGPEVRSLSNFWFLLLLISVGLYTIGYWRMPAALVLPPLVLFGWIGVASVAPDRLPFPNTQGYWGESIALHESRMFDGLALMGVLHFAILAGVGRPINRLAWATAVPQAGLLIFLYHARSSLGWQYLALFSLVGLRVGWWVLNRIRTENRPTAKSLARPLFVAGLLALSLVGLKQYQRAVYHRNYTKEYGQRTFWHNALMGLAHHPALRAELPMAFCDDRDAVDLVLARMEKNDAGLDRSVWNWQAALNSLGNHNRFDWNRYESEARTIYFEQWRASPVRMAECYLYYKPRDTFRQARIVGDRLATGSVRAAMPEFLTASILVLAAVAIVAVRAKRDRDLRLWLRSLSRLLVVVMPFSLVPGIAFYPALTTVACFYLLGVTLVGLLLARIPARVSNQHE